jgi:gamma-butyrobetaine dioxygenase
MFNILNVSTNINPKNYSVGENGSLEIEWSEGDHKSSYDPFMAKRKLLYFKK